MHILEYLNVRRILTRDEARIAFGKAQTLSRCLRKLDSRLGMASAHRWNLEVRGGPIGLLARAGDERDAIGIVAYIRMHAGHRREASYYIRPPSL